MWQPLWDVCDIRVPFRCRFTLQDVIAGLSQLSMALRQGYIKCEIKTIRNYLIGTVQCIDIDRSSMVKPPLSKTLVKGISERQGTSFSQPQRAGQSVPLVPKQSDISSAARFAIAGKLAHECDEQWGTISIEVPLASPDMNRWSWNL